MADKSFIKDVEPISTLLESLENLGALPGKSLPGLFDIKPFKAWRTSPWRDKIFTMRLVNAGEVLQITEYTSKFDKDTKVAATRHELIIRSVFKIDSEELVQAEKLQEYNKNHNSELTTLEYLRAWSHNLEQIVINQLDATIAELQVKQIRILQGIHQCSSCSRNFAEIPEGSKKLIYSVHEIICTDCMEYINEEDWDFEEDIQKAEAAKKAKKAKKEKKESESEVESTVDDAEDPYICVCGKKFLDLSEYTTHRDTCSEVNKVAEK